MKSNHIFFFIVSVFTLSSCIKDLDVLPNDNMTESEFLSEEQNAVKMINGIYNKQLDWNMYSFSWIGITSITSDDADKGSSSGDGGTDKKKMDNLTWDKSDISFQDIWNSRYDGIYRANNAIFYIDKSGLETANKNKMIAEAKFLRSLYFFDLVRCFGGVPIVTEPVDVNNNEAINTIVFSRKTVDEVYHQIETDLIFAAEHLPLKSNYGSNDIGRATKGAAQALLAKAYLYQKKWTESYNMANEVISSGQYSLMDNYADVWKEIGENKQESIYEVQATLNKGLQGYTDVQGPRGTPDLGWGFNTPSASLIASYEEGDLRKEATILVVGTVLWDGFDTSNVSWTNPYYNYKTYYSSIMEPWNNNKGETAKNLRILKYSDLLLIKAEAAAQLSMSGMEIAGIINPLRVRANLLPLTSAGLEEVYKERRAEMAMEHERWFDLVRTGRAQQAMSAVGKTFVVGKHEVFPIPDDQIILSGGLLQQNNNY